MQRQINSEHYFYRELVNYLKPLYKNISNEQLEQLSICSYAYFLFVLEIDQLLDEKDQKENEHYTSKILMKLAEFEETIKKLVTLFPMASPFWTEFDKCKKLYVEANILEKGISKLNEHISLDTFEKLASGKSALCFATIDALVCLSGDNNHSKDLKIFLKHFHIAFQYRDDIFDFKKDIVNGQKTFIYEELQHKLETLKIPFDKLSLDEKFKYIFLTGLATKHLEKAIYHYQIAFAIVKGIELDALAEYINKQIEECTCRIFEIDNLIEKAKYKSAKSFSIKNNCNTKNKINLINDALNYLSENIDKDGFWSDFLTSKGAGKYWVTSYVGFNILEPNWTSGIGNTVRQIVSKINVKGLQGSYNENMIPDGDSMNFYIGFLKKLNMDIKPDQLNKWLGYYTQTGGWITYNNVKKLQRSLHEGEIDVLGWTSTKDCVTAAACYILSDFTSLNNVFVSTGEYLIKRFNENGRWQSYWWSDDLYATSFALCALKRYGKSELLLNKSMEWIIGKQNSDGGWQNDFTKENSAFYTGLAIKALLAVDKNKYRSQIEKGIEFLLLNQLEDGGWFGTYSLRVPATNIEDIHQINTWRKGSLGANIITDDYNRIMTTSTVINAIGGYLTSYQKS